MYDALFQRNGSNIRSLAVSPRSVAARWRAGQSQCFHYTSSCPNLRSELLCFFLFVLIGGMLCIYPTMVV